MKTVKEIAFKLEVSQVTVYNHIKKLDDKLKGSIFQKQGVTHLNEEGIRQLKISMGLLQVPTVKENISTGEIIQEISTQVSDEVTKTMKEDNKALLGQVESLQSQVNRLIDLIEREQQETFMDKLKGLFK